MVNGERLMGADLRASEAINNSQVTIRNSPFSSSP